MTTLRRILQLSAMEAGAGGGPLDGEGKKNKKNKLSAASRRGSSSVTAGAPNDIADEDTAPNEASTASGKLRIKDRNKSSRKSYSEGETNGGTAGLKRKRSTNDVKEKSTRGRSATPPPIETKADEEEKKVEKTHSKKRSASHSPREKTIPKAKKTKPEVVVSPKQATEPAVSKGNKTKSEEHVEKAVKIVPEAKAKSIEPVKSKDKEKEKKPKPKSPEPADTESSVKEQVNVGTKVIKDETKEVKKKDEEAVPKTAEEKPPTPKERDAETSRDKFKKSSKPGSRRLPPRVASKNCPGSSKETQKIIQEIEKNTPVVAKPSSSKSKTVKVKWVQCDRCSKWRQLPGTVKDSKLPDIWYCEMNIWDKNNNTCSGRRDSQEDSNSNKRNRAASKPRAVSKEDNDSRPAAKRSGSSINTRLLNNGSGSSSNGGKSTWHWVMCETCQQWRKLPPEVVVEKLPDKWYCHMNRWDVTRNSCSAPQEADDAAVQKQQAAIEANKPQIKLPDGINLYGGQFMPATGNKKVPLNFRELIVHHYTHFKTRDALACNICNARYRKSSTYVARDLKNKVLQSPAQTSFFASLTSNASRTPSELPICAAADPAFHHECQSVLSKQRLINKPGDTLLTQDRRRNDFRVGRSFLKLSKPWRNTGGFQAADASTSETSKLYYCANATRASANSNK